MVCVFSTGRSGSFPATVRSAMRERPVVLIADDEADVVALLRVYLRPIDCEILIDRATGLPTVAMALDRLKEVLIEQSEMGILFVDIEQFEAIEAEYGWAFFDEFLRRAGEAVAVEARERFSNPMVVANLVGG